MKTKVPNNKNPTPNNKQHVKLNKLGHSLNNIIFLAGKYDFDSKYNTKNLTRYLKETREISAIPYNKLFDEASMEGQVADFFLKYRGMTDQTDRNVKFIKEL